MTPVSLQHIDLELTNVCNLKCWMCPRNDMTRPNTFIRPALVEKIAAEAAALGVRSMNLHLFGESLLHPELREILTILRRHLPAAWLSFSTNASFLTPERFAAVSGLLDNLFVSIDGMDENTYAQHRVGGSLTTVLDNLERVLRCRQAEMADVGLRPKIHVRMIDLGQAENEFAALCARFRPLLRDTDEISRKMLESFGGSVGALAHLRKAHCPFLDWGLAIYADGRVTTCCYDVDGKNLIGDAERQTLADILRSPGYARLRTLYVHGQLQAQEDLLCHTCLAPQQPG